MTRASTIWFAAALSLSACAGCGRSGTGVSFAEFQFRLDHNNRIGHDLSYAAFERHYGPPDSSVTVGHEIYLHYTCLDGVVQVPVNRERYERGELMPSGMASLVNRRGAPIRWTPDDLPAGEKAERRAAADTRNAKYATAAGLRQVRQDAEMLCQGAAQTLRAKSDELWKKLADLQATVDGAKREIAAAKLALKHVPEMPKEYQEANAKRENEKIASAEARIAPVAPAIDALAARRDGIEAAIESLNGARAAVAHEEDPTKAATLLDSLRRAWDDAIAQYANY